jgi:hypothetical protein
MLCAAFSSCSQSALSGYATGAPYEIVVSMSNADWNGAVGDAVKDDLTSAVPFLPQPEPSFRMMFASKENGFGSLLQYVRNIFVLDINPSRYTAVGLHYTENTWAKGQVVLTMEAPDTASVLEYYKTHPRGLTRFFTRVEMRRATALLETEYNKVMSDSVQRFFNIMLNVPYDMNASRRESHFYWISNNATRGMTSLLVYDFPYTDVNTFTREYLMAKRDSVLKLNMQGQFPDTYMETDTLLTDYTAIVDRGKYCGVLRGLWRMKGDMMGGPFVSHFRLDTTANRIVAVEAFVYAPESTKRNYLRRAEASLFSLRLPGEFEQPVLQPESKRDEV